MSQDPQIRRIPIEALPDLREKVAKLGDRADKLGVDRPELILHGEPYRVNDPQYSENNIAAMRRKGIEPPTISVVDVEVKGPVIKREGWNFHAKIEHTPKGNIIHSVRGDIETTFTPEKYRFAPPNCEHCKTDRRRKFTYIVSKENV